MAELTKNGAVTALARRRGLEIEMLQHATSRRVPCTLLMICLPALSIGLLQFTSTPLFEKSHHMHATHQGHTHGHEGHRTNGTWAPPSSPPSPPPPEGMSAPAQAALGCVATSFVTEASCWTAVAFGAIPSGGASAALAPLCLAADTTACAFVGGTILASNSDNAVISGVASGVRAAGQVGISIVGHAAFL